jgi:Peptidase C13 family
VRKFASLVLAAAGAAAVLAGDLSVAAGGPRADEARAVFERQPQVLERALSEVLPAEAGRPHFYFVGFAGFGGQAVFKREVIAVRQLFDGKFDTKGRSLALINHRSTLGEVPLASVANLDNALQYLGRVMDVEHDTLFLFVSSHGDDGLVAVEMAGFTFDQLRPEPLKAMLDRSGIRNRVIVVSACHSGSFIPTLADANTMVIAAARADRSSFGCEDRRQWTYFGDAYFNRALRGETSFRKAFERARKLIATWEAKDHLLPSHPQIAGGEALPGID